ncbi:hypothetical protein Naga_100568g1 [Nannochloropsis gaditana]|uniref:Uncharacterized protein n=1 Tax=Nannochloropsis gaditana TaxID=72520 RepID=W7U4C4_9STRA|nr:hypothetical protein Naga_100568g1 [Nannochloropsis gaditana]
MQMEWEVPRCGFHCHHDHKPQPKFVLSESHRRCSMAPSSLKPFGQNGVHIAGALTDDEIKELAPRFPAWLYLCCDTGSDTGAPNGGFPSVARGHDGGKHVHVPVDHTDLDMALTRRLLGAYTTLLPPTVRSPLLISCYGQRVSPRAGTRRSAGNWAQRGPLLFQQPRLDRLGSGLSILHFDGAGT